jgi:hypothetical protein
VNLSTPDLRRHVLFGAPTLSADISVPMAVTLTAGHYALIFGSGLFGATDGASVTINNSQVGSPSWFFYSGVDKTWKDTNFDNMDDIRLFVRGNRAADFQEDGDVDATDLALWRAGFAVQATSHVLGDGDSDNDVDGADFLLWQSTLGESESVSLPVPEPSHLGATLLASVCTGLRQSRTRRSN